MKKLRSTNDQIIRVAVVEDHTVVRQSLVMMLKKEPQIVVCFQAENGQDFLNQLPNHAIDIVLLDLEMPVMDGRETLYNLKRNYPALKIVLLSMYEDPWIVSELLKEGASSFLRKNCSFDELVDALFDIKFKGNHVTPLMENSLHMISSSNELSIEKSLKYQFSSRELLVLKLICDGKTSDQIAERMHLSKKSIDGIRAEILKNIGAKNSAELVRKSVLHGLYSVRSDEQIIEEEQKLAEAKKERRMLRIQAQIVPKK